MVHSGRRQTASGVLCSYLLHCPAWLPRLAQSWFTLTVKMMSALLSLCSGAHTDGAPLQLPKRGLSPLWRLLCQRVPGHQPQGAGCSPNLDASTSSASGVPARSARSCLDYGEGQHAKFPLPSEGACIHFWAVLHLGGCQVQAEAPVHCHCMADQAACSPACDASGYSLSSAPVPRLPGRLLMLHHLPPDRPLKQPSAAAELHTADAARAGTQ